MSSESANEKIIPSGRSGKTSWRRGYLNWALKNEQPVLTWISPSIQPLDWACLILLGRTQLCLSRTEESQLLWEAELGINGGEGWGKETYISNIDDTYLGGWQVDIKRLLPVWNQLWRDHMGQFNGVEEHMTPGGCERQHRSRGHYEPMTGGGWFSCRAWGNR